MNLFTSHNGNNHTNWHNNQYDGLIAAAEGEQNPKARADLYAQADKLLCREQAVIMPTFLASQNLMVKPWVKGMKFNALDLQFYKDVSVDVSNTK